ncbi:MAG: FKBP-type peptidyl-prolyl cis-trans isomerase [Bacteroidota bacterium]|nr:FKBP-type peptidyl-prolyl cis-trans isomerase [Bacteroidota bacterium]
MKHTLILSLCLLVVLGFSTCGEKKSEYPGYTPHQNGFFYKLIKIGDEAPKCQYNDYVTVDINYKTIKDSLFFSGRRKFQISKPDFPGAIDECLTFLAKDDSASFIISASQFFKKTLSSNLPSFLKEGDKIKVDVSIIDIQTPKQYAKEKEAFLRWIDDFGEYEKTILKQYIDGAKIKSAPLASGMYHLVLKAGNERAVKVGDTVVVHYEGRFLNGKFFDSTRERHEAFQFVYGQQWQVIKGMEEAIGMMHEGEKALFIMPSELGFGTTGSSTGIIPPFTSLIFEVELESIKSGK